jgi:hypothetical protein
MAVAEGLGLFVYRKECCGLLMQISEVNNKII